MYIYIGITLFLGWFLAINNPTETFQNRLMSLLSITLGWSLIFPYIIHEANRQSTKANSATINGLNIAYIVLYILFMLDFYDYILQSNGNVYGWLVLFIIFFIVWTIPILQIINKYLRK